MGLLSPPEFEYHVPIHSTSSAPHETLTYMTLIHPLESTGKTAIIESLSVSR